MLLTQYIVTFFQAILVCLSFSKDLLISKGQSMINHLQLSCLSPCISQCCILTINTHYLLPCKCRDTGRRLVLYLKRQAFTKILQKQKSYASKIWNNLLYPPKVQCYSSQYTMHSAQSLVIKGERSTLHKAVHTHIYNISIELALKMKIFLS